MTRRNARLDNLGYRLSNQLAELHPLLLEHWHEQDIIADGYKATTLGHSPDTSGPTPHLDGPCHTHTCTHHRPCPDHDGATLTTVERAAAIRHTLSLKREELRDRIEGLIITVDELDKFIRSNLGARIPRHLGPRCGDWGDGKPWEGHLLAWSPGSRDDRNGWHHPGCQEMAGWSGLCPTCLLRMNRWRERNGLDWVSEGAERGAA
jgi:hypothetical protein